MTNIEESNFEKNLVALVTEFLVDQKFLSQACCQKSYEISVRSSTGFNAFR